MCNYVMEYLKRSVKINIASVKSVLTAGSEREPDE